MVDTISQHWKMTLVKYDMRLFKYMTLLRLGFVVPLYVLQQTSIWYTFAYSNPPTDIVQFHGKESSTLNDWAECNIWTYTEFITNLQEMEVLVSHMWIYFTQKIQVKSPKSTIAINLKCICVYLELVCYVYF